jgi:uncharacterized membrane protein
VRTNPPLEQVIPAGEAGRLGWAAFALMAASQVALGALDPAGAARVTVNSLTVAALALASTAFAAERWGWRRALAALAAVATLTLAAEVVGVRSGWPFGRYAYTGVLAPSLAGVPLLVPLAWFGLGLPASQVAAELGGPPAARVAAGAVALTAWDLFLDPQMLAEGCWRWAAAGPYRGVPLTNFAGWLLVGALVMVVIEAVLPARSGRRGPGPLVVYTWTAGAEAFAFAFLFGDAVVALAGGLAMGALAAAAWARRAGHG